MQAREQRKNSSFSMAFWVLSSQQCKALETLYAYCRTVDDIVDEQEDPAIAAALLNHWEKFLLKQTPAQNQLQHDLNQLFINHPRLQVDDFLWILRGMRMDLNQSRYQNNSQLLAYCDAVAGAVGLCVLVIMGLNREQHYDFAINTGRALQLTNIIRDIKEDALRNRVYIPQSILIECGYTEKDLFLESDDSPAFKKMMIRMDKWAQDEYEKSEEYQFEHSQNWLKSLPAQIMRKAYAMLLRKISRGGYKVFAKKIKLNLFEKGYLMLWSVYIWMVCTLKTKTTKT